MKQLFGFILLVGVALLLLTVISGIGGIFSSIAATWQPAQTAEIATGLNQVLWLGGIVFVMVLGYGLFCQMSKSGKGWSSRPQPGEQYQVLPSNYQPSAILPPPTEQGDWYELEQPEHEATYR